MATRLFLCSRLFVFEVLGLVAEFMSPPQKNVHFQFYGGFLASQKVYKVCSLSY